MQERENERSSTTKLHREIPIDLSRPCSGWAISELQTRMCGELLKKAGIDRQTDRRQLPLGKIT